MQPVRNTGIVRITLVSSLVRKSSKSDRITKTGINNEFANWYQGTYCRGGPTNKEVHERLDAELGK